MPLSTYPVDEATTDIRDLQRMSTIGLIDADDSDAAESAHCTTVSCRYDWTTCG
jgi:hypothetical protein